jgi:hypothetical protein
MPAFYAGCLAAGAVAACDAELCFGIYPSANLLLRLLIASGAASGCEAPFGSRLFAHLGRLEVDHQLEFDRKLDA